MPRLNIPNPDDWPNPTVADLVKLCSDIDKGGSWMDRRDASTVALIALFGKRSAEVVAVRKMDVWTDKHDLYVRFTVLKNTHPPYKICRCGQRCRVSWKLCPKCGFVLKDLPIVMPKRKNLEVVKSRGLKHPLVRFVLNWLDRVPTPESFLCARSPIAGIFGKTREPDWSMHLDRTGIDHILQKHGTKLWSHLFRHRLATNFASIGRDEFDLMDWFDWFRYETAHRYIKMGGGRRIKEMGGAQI